MRELVISIILILVFVSISTSDNWAQTPQVDKSRNLVFYLDKVTYNKELNTALIEIDSSVNFKDQRLNNTKRIFIDLINSKFLKNKEEININNDYLKSIRIAQNNTDIVRIVFDIKKETITYNIAQIKDGLIVTFSDINDEKYSTVDNKDYKETSNSKLLDTAIRAETKKDWNKALKIYNQILETEKDNSDLYKRVADIHFRLGNYEAGALSLEKAAIIKPNEKTYVEISEAYSLAEKPELSLKFISKAIELNPKNKDYLDAQASLANWAENYEISKNAYKRILDIDPEEDDILFKLGNVMNWTGDSDEAVYYYKKHLSSKPNDSKALLNLAKVESFRGNYDASLRTIEEYKQLEGEDKNFKKERSRALIFSGSPRTGLELVSSELKSNPDDYDLSVLKTFAFLNSRYFSDAKQSLDNTIKLDPNNPYNKDFARFIETPLKSSVSVNGSLYFDTDDIFIIHEGVDLNHKFNYDTSLRLNLMFDQLTADDDSPFARTSDEDYIKHYNGLIGINHFINPDLEINLQGGIAFTDEDVSPTYNTFINYWPIENLKISLNSSLSYYIVSPLSVEENVRRFVNTFAVQYQPYTGYHINADAGINFYTDDNRQWEINLAPRKEILRLEHFNLDLGLSGYWFGFDEDLDNGYFDPQFYQRYLFNSFGYVKINDDNGIALSGGIGVQEDDISDEFNFSANASTQFFHGINKDWFFILGGSYFNTRLPSGAFDAFSFQLSLTKRY